MTEAPTRNTLPQPSDACARPSQLLAAARERLVTYGWRQDGAFAEDGSMCLVNAVAYNWSFEQWAPQVRTYLAVAIFGAEGVEWSPIWQWNDRTGTTFTDVLDVLAHAEKLAREDEEATE